MGKSLIKDQQLKHNELRYNILIGAIQKIVESPLSFSSKICLGNLEMNKTSADLFCWFYYELIPECLKTKEMSIVNKKYFLPVNILISILICLTSYSQVSDKLVINGIVTDAKTGFPLIGVSVLLNGTTVGTITDKDGKYNIETNTFSKKIVFSFLGYQTESRSLVQGKVQTINVGLKLSVISLEEVKVRPSRQEYKNKKNPAVLLIDKVISKKKVNNEKSFNYLEYKQYEKIQFALSNISEKFKQADLLKKFRFIFDNIDTTKRIGKNILPLFIKEELSDHYYRKTPQASKDIIRAQKTINLDEYLDNKGVAANLNYLYHNINIYDNEILFLTNTFISPISNNAPLFYRYYIIDTLAVDSIKCVRMFFEPRNKADFLFHGHLYITLDSSYAVRKIDMGLNKNINIDWVKDISITQDFDKFGQKTWLLSKDEISIDFGLQKNSMGLYGQRTISFKDYKINQPIDEKIFRGPEKIEKIEPKTSTSGFWESSRYVPLSKSEKGIYTTIDSIKKIPAFKRNMNLLMLFTTGFLNLGTVDIGPAESFYSYNPVEGSRFRFGGRTTPDFNKRITLEAYAAYGLKDRIIKYETGITYSLTPRTIYSFPVKSIKLSYLNDTKIPGQELLFTQGDNIFLSVKRGVNNNFLLNKILNAEFLNEFENHFSYTLGYRFTRQSTEGSLHFISSDTAALTPYIPYINISEFSLNLRYAPNESFYQGKLYRFPLPGKYPVIQLKIAGGVRSIHNDFSYMRFQMSVSKRFYLSVLGYTDVSIDAGKITGKVPFPLLFIHNANQTYSYQKDTYSMMNFLEFVSDQYVSLNIDHSFNGFFLNKIPLIKKLKLREIVTFKALYGGLSNINNPSYQNDLLKFPVNINGLPLTYTFEKKPYIEAGIGVSNVLKIFRVDLIKRITYLNHPNVSDIGIRIQFRFDI